MSMCRSHDIFFTIMHEIMQPLYFCSSFPLCSIFFAMSAMLVSRQGHRTHFKKLNTLMLICGQVWINLYQLFQEKTFLKDYKKIWKLVKLDFKGNHSLWGQLTILIMQTYLYELCTLICRFYFDENNGYLQIISIFDNIQNNYQKPQNVLKVPFSGAATQQKFAWFFFKCQDKYILTWWTFWSPSNLL